MADLDQANVNLNPKQTFWIENTIVSNTIHTSSNIKKNSPENEIYGHKNCKNGSLTNLNENTHILSLNMSDSEPGHVVQKGTKIGWSGFSGPNLDKKCLGRSSLTPVENIQVVCLCGHEYQTKCGFRKHAKKCPKGQQTLIDELSREGQQLTCVCGKSYKLPGRLNSHQQACKTYELQLQMEAARRARSRESERSTHKYYCVCGQSCETPSGISKHRKKCQTLLESKTTETQKSLMTVDPMNRVAELLEIQQKTIITLVDKLTTSVTSTTNTVNHIHDQSHSHNKTFNLNFFLNEQCKDAMNIMDFMTSIPITLQDLECVGDKGYIEGITDIISSQLSSLDVHKRPIHCSDAKRQVLHVKHEDKWQKEVEGFPIFRNALSVVGGGLMQTVGKWAEEHPMALNSTSTWNDRYMKIIKQATGGHGNFEENNTKVMRKLVRLVVIDKEKS